jgi:ketosteroid isomerase-like protein
MLLAAGSAQETQVRAAHDAFNAAAKAKDKAKLEKLIADEVRYAHSNAKIETKAEAIASFMKTGADFELQPGSTVNVYGNTAVWQGKMTAHNPAGDINLDMVQVWVKKGGGWQMVSRHTCRTQPPSK